MVVRYKEQLVQESDKKNQCECFRIKIVQTGTDTNPATERRVTGHRPTGDGLTGDRNPSEGSWLETGPIGG